MVATDCATPHHLYKAHGLGNDYFVALSGPTWSADVVRKVCSRHQGVGADGLLVPETSVRADFGVQILNPDGSRAEKSGNGLRIFAHWLHHEQGAPNAFLVDTGFDVVRCRVTDDVVEIEMGRATVGDPTTIRLDNGDTWTGQPVNVGNPHFVVWVDAPFDTFDWRTAGGHIGSHQHFPNRTNVQFVRTLSRKDYALRIVERGAGPTQASGSSACAVAAAAVHAATSEPGRLRLEMQGGDLTVDVDSSLSLRLTGPVEPIGHLHIHLA